MAVREILLPWLSQPQEPVSFNPEWTAKGLVYASTLTGVGASEPGQTTRYQGTKRVVTQTGVCTGFNTTLGSSGSDLVRTSFFRDSPVRTYAFRAYKRSGGGGNLGRVFTKFTSGTESELLYANDFSTPSRIDFERQTGAAGSGNRKTVYWDNGFPNGSIGYFVLITDFSTSANAIALYRDGVLVPMTVNIGSSLAPAPNAQEIVIGNRSTDLARTWDGWIGDFSVFDGVLSPAEAQRLTENPYAIYAPASIWVPVTAVPGQSHDAAGALSAAAGQVSGTAARKGQHAASGALASQAAIVTGSANRVIPHGSAGALSGSAATVAGAAARTRLHAAIGDLGAAAAGVAGTASRADPIPGHNSAGVLVAGAAAAAGAAARTHVHGAAGALVADAAAIAGAAAHTKTHTAAGVLLAGAAGVSGEAYIGTEPPPAGRLGGFEMGGPTKPRRVHEVDRKPLLQRILEARMVRVEPPKAKPARKKAKALEVQAAQVALEGGGEQRFKALMQQWAAQVPAAQQREDGPTAAFLAAVHRRVLEIQDEEDAIALLLLD